MAQDFANKKSSPMKSSSPKSRPRRKAVAPKAVKRKVNSRKTSAPLKKAPFWAWLLIGIGLICFALFLSQLSSKASKQKSTTPVKVNGEAQQPEKQNSQVRFDFYEILKGHEVEVDAKVIDNTPKKSDSIYWLQAASFKQAADADQLRVKLLLLNLAASTQKTTNKQQVEWHRVMVGPFSSRSKLAKARSILASNEISSILINRKAAP
jgi:cell division septation protein DedD